MAAIRVVVAEDHMLLREGICGLIRASPDLELAGVATDLPELRAVARAQRPDVVVTDIRMPPGGSDEGIQAARWLRDTMPRVGVVLLSQFTSPGYALALLEDGAAGRAYLLKERVTSVDDLAVAIRTVAQGGSMIDPRVVDELVRQRPERDRSALSVLTVREREILAQMAEGKNNASIASALFVTERAVEKHTNSIFAKMGLAEVRDVNRRVKAVLVYLSDQAGTDDQPAS